MRPASFLVSDIDKSREGPRHLAYAEKHALKDGKVLVHTRTGSRHATYQARIRLPGLPYVNRSLKTRNLTEALSLAADLYDELRYGQKHGLDINHGLLTFAGLWKKFRANSRLSVDRTRLFDGTARRYYLPYFQHIKLSNLTDRHIEEYWDWRINYWRNEIKKQRATPPNVAEIPSEKSLQMEATMLKQIFKWGRSRNYCKLVPQITAPKTGKKSQARPTFDLKEWKRVAEALLERSNQPGLNSRHAFERRMLRDYFQFQSLSGLRPQESRELRWRDIDEEDGVVIVAVSPHRKTGMREVSCLENTSIVLARIKSYSNYTSADDFVFCTYSGTPNTDFNKSFIKLLDELKLREDRWGRKRVIYSLRHYYATQQILGNPNISLHQLARNMGTSTKQIDFHYSHLLPKDKAAELASKRKPLFPLYKIEVRKAPKSYCLSA